MDWRKWSNDQQAMWVFRMTVTVLAAGLALGIVLGALLR